MIYCSAVPGTEIGRTVPGLGTPACASPNVAALYLTQWNYSIIGTKMANRIRRAGRRARSDDMTESARELGRLLQDLVNRVSHRGGQTLALMTEAEVTLQQVLLLTRLRQANRCSVSEFADQLGLSLPAISQAVERLKRLDMVTRIEDPTDRRRKQLATTRKAHALLDR